MIRTSVRTNIEPGPLITACTKAEHAVAVQVERDCRPRVPAATGRLRRSARVYGRTIVWDTPYARMLYSGNVYVDPKCKKAGFVYPKLGIIRSRQGVKKVKAEPERKFNIRRGESDWFYDTKRAMVGRWVRVAGRVTSDG